MTQVLPVEHTLTGNVLPSGPFFPVQRSIAPFSAVAAPPEVFAGPRPLEAAGERVTPVQRASIEQQRGQGQPLEPGLRQHFEATLGASLAEVRVHTGQAAHITTQSLNAIAFASGADVFFTQSAFEPHTPQGLGLIGHELAHVVQQQYGLPGDADALRSPADPSERDADRMAAQALTVPVIAGETAARAITSPPGSPVQRVLLGQFSPLSEPDALPTSLASYPLPITSDRLPVAAPPDQPHLSTTLGGGESETPVFVQRVGLGLAGDLAHDVPAELPSLPRTQPRELPAMRDAPDRVGGLTGEIPGPTSLASGLSQRNLLVGGALPPLGSLSSLAQVLPLLDGLPSADSLPLQRSQASPGGLPGGAAELADQPPTPLGRVPPLTSQSPPTMPGLVGWAEAFDSGLPVQRALPPLGGQPGLSELPALSSLRPPAMPLTKGLGGPGQMLASTAQSGQEALGSITGLGPAVPAAPEVPAAPPLPTLEKLTEHIWKQVQHKLKVERERSRGLA
jgi:hypothetical protein